MRVTLDIPSAAVWEQLHGLLPYLNIRVVEAETGAADGIERTRKALEITRLLAQRGTVDAAIEAPSAWQREMREDRPLDF